ncbi:MAG TPA: substrate-binding domain-containing protein [Solirubrobacteraceae bacterium]|jgi:ribose transport system substrate-binding protein
MRPVRLVSIMAVLAALVLAACGGSGSGSSSTGGASASASPADQPTPTSGCGSYTLSPPPDPNGILKRLGRQYEQAFVGSTTPIQASAWGDWKPSHGPPYTVGIQWNVENNDYQIAVTRALKAVLKSDPMIGNVIYQTTGNSVDVGAEIQQFNGLVQKHPDILILQPLTGEAFTSQVDRAAAQGIPTISAFSTIPTKNAVSVHPNDQYNGAVTMGKLAQIMGSKGSLLLVHAIPGETEEINTMKAAKAVLARCPQIKVAGQVYGSYSTSLAKSETLKFLATHPQKINGAFQTAVMAPGVMSAFQQTGRQIPPVNDIGSNRGSLGYWLSHKGSYHGVGAGLGAEAMARALGGVARRMLRGQGIRISDVQHPNTIITDRNLSDWAQPGWTLTTPGIAEGPAEQFMSDEFLNGLFAQGETPK